MENYENLEELCDVTYFCRTCGKEMTFKTDVEMIYGVKCSDCAQKSKAPGGEGR